jgi:hypothetical protein
MEFKTKDLLVTVLPKTELPTKELERLCLLRTCICGFHSYCFQYSCYNRTCLYVGSFCGICSVIGTGGGGCGILHSCGPGFSACDPTVICPGGSYDPFVIRHIEDLASIRAELQDTLKKLDEVEKAGLPSAIRSKSEADALESGLTEILEQIRNAKKGLK